MTQSRRKDLIGPAFSAEVFDELSVILRDQLTQHLSGVLDRSGKVQNRREPEVNIAAAAQFLKSGSADVDVAERFRALVARTLESGQNLHHPRYIGHQVPASSPVAALFDSVSTVTNQVMAVYEMGPWGTAVEYALIRALCEKVGWDAQASGGVLTHGGSLANLTALLTARNSVFPDSWSQGVPRNAVLVAHADAHYCVTRSAGILGLGTAQVVKAALDDRRRMDPDSLDRLLDRLSADGKQVMAVSACACATPTGAFDALTEVADVCRRYGVWMHVDAAHGGGVLMSRRHRHLLNGLDKADSIVWDAHKMMFVPALCAAVLYRNRAHRLATFQQDAPYLFDPSGADGAEYDSGLATVECTKRSMGLGLWGLWSLFGEEVFEQIVDRVFERTQELHQLILESDGFHAVHQPECNILVFRHIPNSLTDAPRDTLNRFQQQIRSRLVRSGEFYIVQTVIDGDAALRVTLMNPMTSVDDLKHLLKAIRHIGSEILNVAESASD